MLYVVIRHVLSGQEGILCPGTRSRAEGSVAAGAISAKGNAAMNQVLIRFISIM